MKFGAGATSIDRNTPKIAKQKEILNISSAGNWYYHNIDIIDHI